MENQRLLECLDSDYRRLRELAGGDLTAKVPTCPEWTVADLASHVAMVYAHKAETLRRGEWPKPWPPEKTGESPAELLERAYAELTAEFAARPPTEPALTWFTPEQHVGFWVRRMAQETVIHRIDAELAAGVASLPVADDLAVDGIDEILRCFLAFSTTEWPEDYGNSLTELDGRVVGVDVGTAAWLVQLAPGGVVVRDADSVVGGLAEAAAIVRADPEAMLRWLWRRADVWIVSIDGDRDLADRLHRLLREATQ